MLFGQFKALISTLATADNVEIIRLNLRNLESSENFMEKRFDHTESIQISSRPSRFAEAISEHSLIVYSV